MSREPVMFIGAIVAVIEAAIAMVIALGYLDWTTEQVGAVMAFVIALGAVVSIYLTRQRVTPLVDPRDYDGTPLERAE